MIFNEFKKERLEFTRNQLHNFLKRKCEEYDFNYKRRWIIQQRFKISEQSGQTG